MNGRHLPGGHGMQQDMSRRRSYNHQHQQPYQQHQPTAPLYNGYMNPYNYYSQLPPQYQHGIIPPVQYPPYQSYGRSPPPQFQQYAHTPPPVVSSYSRPPHSPAVVSTPYIPPLPQRPGSSQSSQTMAAPLTPAVLHIQPAVAQARTTFQPPLPWLSRPDLPWPTKTARSKRVRKLPQASAEAVELPSIQAAQNSHRLTELTDVPSVSGEARPDTPSTTQPSSEEAASTTPTTPSSIQQPTNIQGGSNSLSQSKALPRPVAAIPVVPVVPKSVSRISSGTIVSDQKALDSAAAKAAVEETIFQELNGEADKTSESEESQTITTSTPVRGTPLLWTGLFKVAAPASAVAANDVQTNSSANAANDTFSKTNSDSLADALRAFSATTKDAKLAFIKPRGLVNTGNMCYMNSVLQVLIFCIPFYNYLDEIGKRAAHSFKSDTPLIDAMIMFMREFPVIDSAASLDQLRMRLKENELEQYGEPFTPDFVYDVIRRLPRFSTMRRGHQQDAEEFLGFLLEGLHDECVQVIQSSAGSAGTSNMATPTNAPSSPVSDVASLVGSTSSEGANGWLEVGPRQRAAITRSSGAISESPITKIFGGTLRSELRVPGMKNSVTMEPYQPLQLDIGSQQVNNIIDALKGLTRPETLHGDFKSPRGPSVTATKQVLIETLPPVLILHLKRFQYDNTGGTQKIWKKIGYPLELEIPKEVFSRQKHTSMINYGGLPRYRLMAVVYHHGKNASGGHYTVDVRRQDGREWIRLDDTVIRRVRSEDVAEGGSEEDPKVLAAALEAHNNGSVVSGNMFAQMKMDDEEDNGSEDGWKQVNGQSASTTNGGGKKWSSVVNGTTTPKVKNGKSSIKDNKVAYLLFYQKISA